MIVNTKRLRVFKTKWFTCFARQEGLTDRNLIAAMHEIENGLHNGDLGGGLIKKRIARPGAGKRGGYRTIVASQAGKSAFFIYGFAKNATHNLDDLELRGFKSLAEILLRFNNNEIATAIDAGEIQELKDSVQ